jgi:hypothetical protein
MKFDVDYDKTFKNEILLKAKKIGGGGALLKTTFCRKH